MSLDKSINRVSSCSLTRGRCEPVAASADRVFVAKGTSEKVRAVNVTCSEALKWEETALKRSALKRSLENDDCDDGW